MFNYLLEQAKRSIALKIVFYLFLLLSLYWLFICYTGFKNNPHVDYFTLIYPILALIGGLTGMRYSSKWGGLRSVLGKAIAFLSLGLLAQFLGQLLYIYYIFIRGVNVPYPSVGDLAYFGSVVFYILGVYYLALVSGIRLILSSAKGKLLAIIIPLLMLGASYYLLLKDYNFAESTWTLLFLDFGFPIGQALYVSLALMVLFASKNILAGIMRAPIMLLILALIAQFISDFLFSYFYSIGSDVYMIDYLYASSYMIMAIALIAIGNMFYKVKES